MASARHQLEDGSSDDYRSELNTSPSDELAAVSTAVRGAGELMIIQTFRRYIEPVLTRRFRQIVREEVRFAKQEILASMKENPVNEATTSIPKRLKLQFRNRVCLPVYTGMRLLGENGTSIEIALVDAFTEKIMNTGIESTAKVEIVGFQVGDNDRWTFEEFQEKVMSEKKGKRALQGNTCLQLNEGVCFLSKISFTRRSENIRKGLYRLGAGVVDAGLMNRVEVARTEPFLMKDGCNKYTEKHEHPHLSDKVYRLQQISSKGSKGGRYGRLKDGGVMTVKDLLILLYTDPKRLEDILQVKASSNVWNDIVKNAQASSGMFLWLDSSNEGKPGVVLDVKLQLKGLIVESHKYVPVDELSTKQKVDSKGLVKFAIENIKTLQSFEDETSLREYLISCPLPSPNQSLWTSIIIDEPTTPSSLISIETPHSLTNSNFHIDQHTTHTPTLTSQYERGKSILHGDTENETTYPMNYQQEDMTPHLLNFASTSSQCTIDCLLNDTLFFEEFGQLFGHDSIIHFDCPNNESVNSVSVSTITPAQIRWIKVYKLLTNIIYFKDGIRALKRQRFC